MRTLWESRWLIGAAFVSTVLWVALIALVLTVFVDAQARVPLATEAEKALSPLLISTDGSTVTFRATAPAALKICVEADLHTFTRRSCFTVGDVRDGLVIKR